MERESDMKRKRVWKAAAVAAACLLAAAVFGNPLVIWNNHRLRQAVLAVEGDSVSFNELVPFKWDAVYTFDPYTSKRDIEAELGFRSGSIRETVSEGMVQLIFVRGRSGVCSVCGYSGSLGYRIDFATGLGPAQKLLFSDDAAFAVSREDAIVQLSLQQRPG